MQKSEMIRCRVVACREALDDNRQWSFYLINDSSATFESAALLEIGYEWGDLGSSETTDVIVSDLAPGASVIVWRDDGSGAELRMDLSLCVQMHGREAHLRFEFPKLYQMNLPLVDSLGKPGWQAAAEA